MPIQLITGTPGAGKSAYVVAQLLEMREAAERAGKPPRPIVVMGIPDLTVPHEVAGPVAEWTKMEPTPEDETVLEAVFTFPEGALVVIDEAQKVFRPRAVSSKVPPVVAAFEKHRHLGLDFWLVTQHPTLLDANVRKLIGKHVHLRGTWAGRELLEWPEASDPNSRSERATAIRRRYRLPSKAFEHYKSATVHIKQSRRVPFALWLFLGVSVLCAVLAWRVVSNIRAGASGDRYGAADTPSASGGRAEIVPAAGAVRHAALSRGELTAAMYQPRFKDRPESAPLYDDVRKVLEVPHVVGCIELADACKCFTDQATDAGYSLDSCRAWLKSPPFSPFRGIYPAVVQRASLSPVDPASEAAPASVASVRSVPVPSGWSNPLAESRWSADQRSPSK